MKKYVWYTVMHRLVIVEELDECLFYYEADLDVFLQLDKHPVDYGMVYIGEL